MNSNSKYYKLALGEGLEALQAHRHKTAFPFHFHPTYNITLVYDGTFHTQLNERLVHAPSGTILITNPHEIHANPCDKEDSVSFFTFYISPGFLHYCNRYHQVQFAQKVIYDTDLFRELHRLSLVIGGQLIAPGFEADLKKTMEQLARKYGSADDRPAEQKIHTLFDEFLSEEHPTKFSLTDAAARFGVDKYKFLRLFKFQTGLTPNNYFIMRRIEKSKAMLADGRQLLDIAIELGFYDAAHYCNHFKKYTGISPMTYTLAR